MKCDTCILQDTNGKCEWYYFYDEDNDECELYEAEEVIDC